MILNLTPNCLKNEKVSKPEKPQKDESEWLERNRDTDTSVTISRRNREFLCCFQLLSMPASQVL